MEQTARSKGTGAAERKKQREAIERRETDRQKSEQAGVEGAPTNTEQEKKPAATEKLGGTGERARKKNCC